MTDTTPGERAADELHAAIMTLPCRVVPPYKALLAMVLPLAVPRTGQERECIAAAARALLLAGERAKERAKAYYAANADKCKARAKAQRNPTPEQRQVRYKKNEAHYQAKGREYAHRRRESGKQAAYAEQLKSSGRNRVYQARYKYGDFAEAALVLHDLEQELKAS